VRALALVVAAALGGGVGWVVTGEAAQRDVEPGSTAPAGSAAASAPLPATIAADQPRRVAAREPARVEPKPRAVDVQVRPGWTRAPTEAQVAELERASALRDPAALLALVRGKPGLIRYEALRRYADLAGARGLTALAPDLLTGDDPRLASLLAEAFAAGGTPAQAQQLAFALTSTPPERRALVAAAVLEIAARGGVPESVRAQALAPADQAPKHR
jgi:hypothetical protein